MVIYLEPVLYPFAKVTLLGLVCHMVEAWAVVMSKFEEHLRCLVELMSVFLAEAFSELQLDELAEAVGTICSNE